MSDERPRKHSPRAFIINFRFFLILAGVILFSSWANAQSTENIPQRIASLTPSHTEIVQALGLSSRLVGVSDFETPGTWAGLPRVGGLSPHWETLLTLQPDLILADECHRPLSNTFQRFKLPVVFLPSTTAHRLEDVEQLILLLGHRLGAPLPAEKLVDALRAERNTWAIPRNSPVKVFFEIWPHPLQACGADSLQGDVVRQAGGELLAPSGSDMPLVSSEWVVASAPEIILHTGVISTESLISRPGWETLPAVRSRRVYQVNADLFSRASPGAWEAVKVLRQLLEESQP